MNTKKKERLENKKRKMSALLNITILNENDRLKNTEIEGLTESTEEPELKKLKPNLELSEMKKMLQKRKHAKNHASFRLREMGEVAAVQHDTIDNIVPLFVTDLQNMLAFSQIGAQSFYLPSRWCSIEKYHLLKTVTLIVIENISVYEYCNNESMFSCLQEFPFKLNVVNSNAYENGIIKDLSLIPITKSLHRRSKKVDSIVVNSEENVDKILNLFPINWERPSSGTVPKSDQFPRTELLLSGWQMIAENFPLPLKCLSVCKNYKLTKTKYKTVTVSSPMFAVDCEMCRTNIGELELTRVSIVDEQHNVFYDSLVKPHNQIVDYLTKFSGITAKMMKKVTKRLGEVQEEICNLLPDDAILVGHSLFNDLHALKLMHPYVIDTSVIYNILGERNRKSKLATLAREFLQERIQEKKSGHCSSEDSLACMKLTQMKLLKGFTYGDAVLTRANIKEHSTNCVINLFSQVVKADKSVRIVANEQDCEIYKSYLPTDVNSVEFQIEKSNTDVIQHLIDKENCSLNVAHIQFEKTDLNESNLAKTIQQIDESVKNVEESLFSSSLLCILFASGANMGNSCCFVKIKK